MKRRITALILVVVMLALSLVSCGYSLADDNLSPYATFEGDVKTKFFEEFLKNIVIEDGDFTQFDGENGTSEEIRARLVLENIYATLANKADATDKLTEGTIGAHDLAYYCYYMTAQFDGKTEYFNMTEMKEANADKIQLGLTSSDDKVAEAIRLALNGLSFTADNTYTSPTEGTAAKDDIAFVTYTYEYEGTIVKDDGTESPSPVKKTVTNGMVVVGEGADTFAGILNGKTVGTTVTGTFDFTETRDGKEGVKVTYSGIKINWIGKGPQLTSFKDVTYDEKNELTNTEGTKRDLNNVEITYYVYPVSFVKVDEFTAENVINVILGTSISTSTVYEILFGEDYVGLHEDHKGHSHTKEEQEKNDTLLAELNTMLEAYKTTDAEGKVVTLEELIESIAELQTDYADTKKAFDTAEEDLEKKVTTLNEKTEDYNTKKAEVDNAGESATDTQKTELQTAESAMKSAQASKDSSQAEYDEAKAAFDADKAERDAEVAKLLGIAGASDRIVAGYREKTYNSLQSSYNNEIKMNLAKEIYHYLTENVAVSGAPEKLVESTYDSLIENYEYKFYTGTYNSTTSETNYSHYNGSFESYLVETVTNDIKKVTTYKEALAAVKAEALEQMIPIVRMYVVAKACGDVFVTDAEFKAFKKDADSDYFTYRYGPYGISDYGEDNARYAYQFDELMNYFLESEEVKAEAPDANGYIKITDKYAKVTNYTIGEPASKAEDSTAE